MNVTCSQNDLALALSMVNRAVSPNNTLPVLNNILLRGEGEHLFLSATNLEIAISAQIPAKVQNEGTLTVPAKVLSGYIPLLKEESVQLNSHDLTLEVKSTGSTSKMKGMSAEEFPHLPKAEESAQFSLPAKPIREALEQVVFSASTNISRFSLTGVLWKIGKKELKLAATDSYRLAEKTIPLEKDPGIETTLLIPSRTTQELAKILASTDADEIHVSASKNQVLFKMNGIELMSKLINENFPDYESILPKEGKTKVKVNVADFLLAIKKVMIIVKESNNGILLSIQKGKVVVSTDETQVGEGSAEVDAEMDGDKTDVSLNAQYLLDVLSHLHDDDVYLGLNDGLSPVMLTPVKASGYLHVIMPLKI